MAHSKGVEPLTYGFVVRCSIQLSYECIRGLFYYRGLGHDASFLLHGGEVFFWAASQSALHFAKTEGCVLRESL